MTESLTDAQTRLGVLLDRLDVPDGRRSLTAVNLRWLQRNVAIRNSTHPEFSTVTHLIQHCLATTRV